MIYLTKKIKVHRYSDNDISKDDNNSMDRKAFERGKVKIKSSKLIDDYTVFYDPYKKAVSFKSKDGKSKVISKNYVL